MFYKFLIFCALVAMTLVNVFCFFAYFSKRAKWDISSVGFKAIYLVRCDDFEENENLFTKVNARMSIFYKDFLGNDTSRVNEQSFILPIVDRSKPYEIHASDSYSFATDTFGDEEFEKNIS